MPVIKAITSTNVIAAFSGTPDGTKFLRDDGTLAVGGYSKLTASGVNGGTLTLYDDTATTGYSTFNVRIGADQNDASDNYPLFQVLSNAGSAFMAYPLVHYHAVNGVGVAANSFVDAGTGTVSFALTGVSGQGLMLGNAVGVLWSSNSVHYSAKDLGLVRSAASILKVTDGSSGFGSITAAAYDKMTVSGTNRGTMTLYDNTASTGKSYLTIRAGAGQSTDYLQAWLDSSGLALANIAYNGGYQGPGIRETFDRYFALGGTGLSLGSNSGVIFGSTGDGAATSADLALLRAGANALKVTNNSTGYSQVRMESLGVNNSAAATTPGSCVKKIEVFSATGTSLGFIAVYDAIT